MKSFAYLMPKHCRDPLPNATKYRWSSGFSIQRSGMNDVGSGNKSAFIKTSTVVIETGVFLGMVHSPYFNSVSGASRGSRVTTPWESRTDSSTQAFKKGNFSSFCHPLGHPAAASSLRSVPGCLACTQSGMRPPREPKKS